MAHQSLSFRLTLLSIALGVTACATPSLAPNGDRGTTPRVSANRLPGRTPVSTASLPVATDPAAPALVGATASPEASPSPLPLLQKPTTPVRILSGTVRIDATYAIAKGGAQLLTNNGVGALNVASKLLSDHGVGLLANNGGNLIANNGGSLIGNAGGMLTAQGGRQYALEPPGRRLGLLQAADAGGVKVGEIRPAAGMVVGVRSLATGERLPLGIDAAGNPVTAILTDANGAFEVYVPETSERVIVEARFPEAEGAAATDERLAYDTLYKPSATESAPISLDEDITPVISYMRLASAGILREFIFAESPQKAVDNILDGKGGNPIFYDQLIALVTELNTEARSVGLDKAPRAEADKVANRMAEVILGKIDIEAVALSKLYEPSWTGPEEPAMPALIDIARYAREAATVRLTEDPAYFTKWSPLIQTNSALPAGAPPREIRKPSDLITFMIQTYLIPGVPGLLGAFESVGIEKEQGFRLLVATNTYTTVVALAMASNTNNIKDETLKIVRAYKPQ